MFNDKNKQYINITKYDKQIKVDNKIIQNDKLLKSEHASFIIENTLSADCIAKVNILQKNINNTFISTLCETKDQKVVISDEFNDETYDIRKLNTHYSIAIAKKEIISHQSSFQEIGNDYLFSPYNILYNHIMTNNPNTNSLNILLLNSTVYAFILDDEKRIIYSTLKNITPFEQIAKDEFSQDDLEGQKLFDEIHQMEIQEIITSITTEFYALQTSDIFCESVSIIYTIKQLNENQLKVLEENLMLEIEYNSINLSEELFHLAQSHTALKSSFISPREKKSKKSFAMWVLGAILTTAIAAGIFYYMQILQKQKDEELRKAKIAKIIADKKAKQLSIKLPEHRNNNKLIIQNIKSIFDVIPDNALLNELQLQTKDATIVCTLLSADSYEKTIKPNILKLFKKSEVLLMQKNKLIYNAILVNSGFITQKLKHKFDKPNYRKNRFVSTTNFKQQIKAFLPKNSSVKFIKRIKSKFLINKFTTLATFQNPTEFFNFIKVLNKKSYSIELKYPIEFVKTKYGLETTFDLQFNQFHRK